MPANSFIATAEAVSLVGATPRFADVDAATALISAETIGDVIGHRTRCIIPVHLSGRTVEIAPILALAAERGIPVVEDACQAHGAMVNGARAGAAGIAGCFSFYPAKNLGAWGDGGAIVTSDPGLDERIRLLRTHGERVRYHHEIVGTTARLDALQAAILRVKLRHLDSWNQARRRVGAALARALAGAAVEPPLRATTTDDHVFHHFVVRSDERDRLREHLASFGVASAIHYPIPIHLTPAYESASLTRGSIPVAECLAARICSLPIYPTMTDDEISLVARAVSEWSPSNVVRDGPPVDVGSPTRFCTRPQNAAPNF